MGDNLLIRNYLHFIFNNGIGKDRRVEALMNDLLNTVIKLLNATASLIIINPLQDCDIHSPAFDPAATSWSSPVTS